MPRKKKEDSFFDNLLSKTGGQALKDIGKSLYYIDTGNFALNYICSGKFINGGLPGGKIIEVYGPPMSAKSLLGYTVLGTCQRLGGISVLLDCERAANPDFAAAAGHVDVDKLVIYEPISIEEVKRKIMAATKEIRAHFGNEIPILFVWDSVGVTPTEREWKETELPEEYTKEQYKAIVGSLEKPGERARACGDALRQLNPFLSESNATLFIINQIRQAIGVVFGDDEVTAGGGKALPFYASTRLRTSAHAKIMAKKEKGASAKPKTEIPLGVNLTFRNKKNRSFTPFLTTSDVQLYFDRGINPLGGLLSVLVAAGRVEKSGAAGNYKVNEPWANGKEVKFKSSEARNDVPGDTLLQCPALVDAESEEQVYKYLDIYGAAIDLSISDTTEEVEIKEDDNTIDEALKKLAKGDEG